MLLQAGDPTINGDAKRQRQELEQRVGAEIRTRQLVVLKTTMPCPPIEFFAMRSTNDFEPLNELVIDLATEVSTFTRH